MSRPKFLKLISCDKKTLIFVLGLGLFLSFIPLNPVRAGWTDSLLDLLSTVPVFLQSAPILISFGPIFLAIFIVSHLAVFLSYIFYTVCAALLTWVSSPEFVSLHFTRNDLVTPGLDITTGIVNLGFILVLVFIALSTILKLESYNLKKLLPKFLLIVVLINFVPVICGLVIDTANLATKNFLRPDLLGSLTNIFANNTLLGSLIQTPITTYNSLQGSQAGTLEVILTTIKNYIIQFLTVPGIINLLLRTILTIFFGFFSGFVLLLYTLLFAIRIIALWLLVILAPIAWFCSMLPFAQSYYKMWWNYFLQWSFIGAIGGFFLWLGGRMAGIQADMFGGQLIIADSPGISTGIDFSFLTAVVNQVFIFGAIMAFLIIGFLFSIKTSGGGAETILKWGEQGLRTGFKMAQTKLKSASIGAGAAGGRKTLPTIEKWGKGLMERGEAAGGTKGFLSKAFGKGVSVAAGRALREVKTFDENEISAGKKEATSKDSADNFRIINEQLLPVKNWNRIAGILAGTIANGDSNDIQEALNNGTLSGETMGHTLLAAQRAGPPVFRPIAKALYGRLLSDPEQFGKDFEVEKEADGTIKKDAQGTPIFKNDRVGKIVKEIPEKLSNADISAKILGNTIDKGKSGGKEFINFGGELVIKQLLEIRGGDLIASLLRRPESREGRKAIFDIVRKVDPKELHRNGNDGLIKYLASSAAQGAGVTSPLMQGETNQLLKLLRNGDYGPLSTEDEEKLNELIAKWSGTYRSPPAGPGPTPPPAGPGPSTAGPGPSTAGPGPTPPPAGPGPSTAGPGPGAGPGAYGPFTKSRLRIRELDTKESEEGLTYDEIFERARLQEKEAMRPLEEFEEREKNKSTRRPGEGPGTPGPFTEDELKEMSQEGRYQYQESQPQWTPPKEFLKNGKPLQYYYGEPIKKALKRYKTKGDKEVLARQLLMPRVCDKCNNEVEFGDIKTSMNKNPEELLKTEGIDASDIWSNADCPHCGKKLGHDVFMQWQP